MARQGPTAGGMSLGDWFLRGLFDVVKTDATRSILKILITTILDARLRLSRDRVTPSKGVARGAGIQVKKHLCLCCGRKDFYGDDQFFAAAALINFGHFRKLHVRFQKQCAHHIMLKSAAVSRDNGVTWSKHGLGTRCSNSVASARQRAVPQAAVLMEPPTLCRHC